MSALKRTIQVPYTTRRENLEKLVELYGGPKALAIALSRSPSQIGDMLHGRKGIGNGITEHIESTLGLDRGFLSTPQTAEKMPEVPAATVPPPKVSRVPLLSNVQAGSCRDFADITPDEWTVSSYTGIKDAFALRVEGDSMTPWFNEGDVVVVDPNRKPRPRDFVVARSNLEHLNEITVKQYFPTGYDDHGRELFELRPLNSAYPSMDCKQLRLEVVGVVIELNKRFF